MATWDNIIKAGQAGRMLGDSIGSFASLIGPSPEERRQKEYQMQLLDLRRKQQLEDLANEHRMQAYKNPEMGLIPLQEGQTAQGPVMQESGIPGLAYSQAQKELENKRMLEQLKEKYDAMYGNRPQLNVVYGSDGTAYYADKRTGSASPITIGDKPLQGVPKGERVIQRAMPDGTTRNIKISWDGTETDLGVSQYPTVTTSTDAQGNIVSTPTRQVPGQPVTATPIQMAGSSGASPEQPKTLKARVPGGETASGLRDDVSKDKIVQNFQEFDAQYGMMEGALEESKRTKNFIAVDQALINTFNKMIAPGSVVMPSEYARTPDDQALYNRLLGKWQRITEGGVGLTTEDRDAIHRLSQKYFEKARDRYNERAGFYKNIAEKNGLDPDQVIPRISSSLAGGPEYGIGNRSGGGLQQSNQNSEAMKWLSENPNDPRAPAIRKKLGL
jgi:hypothetical protein